MRLQIVHNEVENLLVPRKPLPSTYITINSLSSIKQSEQFSQMELLIDLNILLVGMVKVLFVGRSVIIFGHTVTQGLVVYVDIASGIVLKEFIKLLV